ncbi:flagellar basal body rod protein FlgB [Vibrio sp. PP-XX7]
MAITFGNAVGVHPEALTFRVQRTKISRMHLTRNADTPAYLAKDLSFTTVMSELAPNGVNPSVPKLQIAAQYSMPYQNRKDGNTVELGVEQAKFTQNSMDFQTSLTFMNMKFNGLSKAIEGR